VKPPSGSTVDRGIHCPSSFVLPQVKRYGDKYARDGKVGHRYIQNARRLGREAALALLPEGEERARWEALDLARMRTDPSLYQGEIAVAYNWVTDTGRIIGDPEEKKDWGTDDELLFVADAIGWGEYVHVTDYKTGYGYVAPAKRNPQLKGTALAACRALGLSKAIIEIIHIDKNGKDTPEQAELDILDLDDFASLLRKTRSRIIASQQDLDQGKQPPVKEGPWCTYCPAKDQCPAKTALLQAVIGQGPGALRHEDMGQIYRNVKTLIDVGDRGLARLKEICREDGPINLGNGRWYGYRGSKCMEYQEKT
jgi:hypothetical protein